MDRIKIVLPENFRFKTEIIVRVTDLNYGAHVGNDRFLVYAQEARMAFLNKAGYSELEFDKHALIQATAAIEFKRELKFGEKVAIWVAAGDFHNFGFNLFYKMEVEQDGKAEIAAKAVTGMICYDYNLKKPVRISEEAVKQLEAI